MKRLRTAVTAFLAFAVLIVGAKQTMESDSPTQLEKLKKKAELRQSSNLQRLQQDLIHWTEKVGGQTFGKLIFEEGEERIKKAVSCIPHQESLDGVASCMGWNASLVSIVSDSEESGESGELYSLELAISIQLPVALMLKEIRQNPFLLIQNQTAHEYDRMKLLKATSMVLREATFVHEGFNQEVSFQDAILVYVVRIFGTKEDFVPALVICAFLSLIIGGLRVIVGVALMYFRYRHAESRRARSEEQALAISPRHGGGIMVLDSGGRTHFDDDLTDHLLAGFYASALVLLSLSFFLVIGADMGNEYSKDYISAVVKKASALEISEGRCNAQGLKGAFWDTVDGVGSVFGADTTCAKLMRAELSNPEHDVDLFSLFLRTLLKPLQSFLEALGVGFGKFLNGFFQQLDSKVYLFALIFMVAFMLTAPVSIMVGVSAMTWARQAIADYQASRPPAITESTELKQSTTLAEQSTTPVSLRTLADGSESQEDSGEGTGEKSGGGEVSRGEDSTGTKEDSDSKSESQEKA